VPVLQAFYQSRNFLIEEFAKIHFRSELTTLKRDKSRAPGARRSRRFNVGKPYRSGIYCCVYSTTVSFCFFGYATKVVYASQIFAFTLLLTAPEVVLWFLDARLKLFSMKIQVAFRFVTARFEKPIRIVLDRCEGSRSAGSLHARTETFRPFGKPRLKIQPPVALAALAAWAILSTLVAQAGTHSWTGAGANKYWNNSANWSGGAPTNNEPAPVVLSFPANAVCTNNIPGLTVDSVIFTSAGCVLHGSAGGSLNFRGAGGTNLSSDAVVFGATNTIASTLPVSLSGSNLFSAGFVNVNIQSVVSGNGDLALTGGAYLIYSGSQPNTATGTTTVLKGFLALGKSPGVNAIAGPLVIGDDDGLVTGEFVILLASNQIPETVPVTIKANSYFRFNGFDEALGPIIFKGGFLETEGGLLTLTTNVSAQSGAGYSGWLVGRVSLGGVTRTFDVGSSAGLSIQAQITDGPAPAGITKTGFGALHLAGTNTFSGNTLINAGTVYLESEQGLGSELGGTTVATNAILVIEGNFIVWPEALTLGGTLQSASTNSWTGSIILLNGSRFDVFTKDQLTLSGGIYGTGPLVKDGEGSLTLSGTLANVYNGATIVKRGLLLLNKTSAKAIPGALIIGDNMDGGANSDIVRLLQSDQIADLSAVTIQGSGWLDLNSQSDTIGSLAGNGTVSMGFGTLTTGNDNTSTSFDGILGGVGFFPLVKNGSGTFILNGTNTGFGTCTVNGGKLVVNGALPCSINLTGGSMLAGVGLVGPVSTSLGKVTPGNSVGKLNTGNLWLNSSSSVDIEINGATPGTGYDQINVTGAIDLSSATLNVKLGFNGAIGQQFVIIQNDGVDAVSGTFYGMPEASSFPVNGVQFQITYKGGSGGNDVVLTQVSLPAPPNIGGLTRQVNGQIQLTGAGIPGYSYSIEANDDLNTANWINLGSLIADPQTGGLLFIDADAPNHSMRFYRFRGN
jgi:autotransporter-associated beta strand protein